jgi:hypothetical protein
MLTIRCTTRCTPSPIEPLLYSHPSRSIVRPAVAIDDFACSSHCSDDGVVQCCRAMGCLRHHPSPRLRRYRLAGALDSASRSCRSRGGRARRTESARESRRDNRRPVRVLVLLSVVSGVGRIDLCLTPGRCMLGICGRGYAQQKYELPIWGNSTMCASCERINTSKNVKRVCKGSRHVVGYELD